MAGPSPISHSNWCHVCFVYLAPHLSPCRRCKNSRKGARKNQRIRLKPRRNSDVQLKVNCFSGRPLKADQPWWKPLTTLLLENITVHTIEKSLRRHMWLLSPWCALLEQSPNIPNAKILELQLGMSLEWITFEGIEQQAPIWSLQGDWSICDLLPNKNLC